jgi:hypothetical protein
MEAFQALWTGDCPCLHAVNQPLVTLLPKHADVVEVRDFRPISLIHSVAKLVARVLSGPRPPHGGYCGTPALSSVAVVFMITSSFFTIRHGSYTRSRGMPSCLSWTSPRSSTKWIGPSSLRF